ncbi:carboxymuconolactone decarboxylase family protein [Hazenella coriacea]|uniref:AhpD family alkylhydroperoxidase n=1 Tax=Hazenella coriacea TaxID=1179467 RepID=A0A4R3LF82_9BACL|nr:carboxymuconolactone decarboxylase family protein [Hazenella coriacea]TCS97034.1 AhpD family alkylhydroperoxidase [Hazenella coriacea]
MEGSMIQQSLQEYKEGVGKLVKQLPDVIGKYNQFTETCFAEGELSTKMKHLIALSLGVYSNDEYCIIYHTKGAVDQGASEQEILEAATVSSAFAGGMAMSQTVTLVQDACNQFQNRNIH